MKYRFGRNEFDTESHQLFHLGEPVSLTPKAYQLMELPLAERPRAVWRESACEPDDGARESQGQAP